MNPNPQPLRSVFSCVLLVSNAIVDFRCERAVNRECLQTPKILSDSKDAVGVMALALLHLKLFGEVMN